METDASILEQAWRCARLCGVTRLGDLTGLDVLAVPVFHAVRPWSRALCVHQGKSPDPVAAKTGALMEAVESHCAEAFQGTSKVAAYADLPASERAPSVDDFARYRGDGSADELLSWTPIPKLVGRGILWAPWLAVSLDLTRDLGGWVERSSNGTAAAFCPEQARLSAICELLERDAMSGWMMSSPIDRALDALDPPDDSWLMRFLAAAAAADVRVSLFGLRSLVGWPVVVCLLEQPDALNARRSRVLGSACRPQAQAALIAAVTEAAQCRLTLIASVRDDILPSQSQVKFGISLAPPLPAHVQPQSFDAFRQASAGLGAGSEDAAVALEAAGFGPVACVELAAPEPAVVVKAFAPGLGGTRRRRRAPHHV